jgi:predicted aldo/keto reductase-like oxidoreductase
VGVSLALAGVTDSEQLEESLHTFDATETERDFTGALATLGQYLDGECVYCNHCLPCPEQLEIGPILRLLDEAKVQEDNKAQALYDALTVKASACTRCGACAPRCPFGVDVMAKLAETVAYFEVC